jgi:hypothetical protein
MSADPDDYLTVSQVCRRLPGARGARHVTPSTVTRWILLGCPARDGIRHTRRGCADRRSAAFGSAQPLCSVRTDRVPR